MYFAHDEGNECCYGDLVRIKECPPITRNKTFRVLEIVERAPKLPNMKERNLSTQKTGVTT